MRRTSAPHPASVGAQSRRAVLVVALPKHEKQGGGRGGTHAAIRSCCEKSEKSVSRKEERKQHQ